MTKELTAQANASLVNWDDKQMQLQIKETYGKGLSDTEWSLFLNLGRATKLNPFLREIWCVKFGTNPASIFIGRDGYRRSAQNHPQYEYHFCDAVYSNDKFSVVKGEVDHTYNFPDRGALVGAYCIVKRRNAAIAVMNYVELKEYAQAFGVWKTKPATMIKKVAEAQGLRAAFQELFAGTYEESENWKDEKNVVESNSTTSAVQMQSVTTNKMITKDQLQELKGMWTTYANAAEIKKEDYATKGTEKLLALFGKTKLTDLTEQEASRFMNTIIADTDALQAFAKQDKKTEEAILATETVPIEDMSGKITAHQTKQLHAVWRDFCDATGIPTTKTTGERKKLMKKMFNVESSTELTEKQAEELINKIQFDLQKAETF